ncbi:MAG: efflux transporter outer membrane subunit [Acetobacteraceae bacterium]|nr:efflux transporter outer membrane subunit [Acetobacteraceae bacterium]
MRQHSRKLTSRFVLSSVLIVCGCAVGPNFRPSAPPAQTGYTPEPLPAKTASAQSRAGAAQHFVKDLDIPGQWWTLLRSKKLNRLVDEALRNNPSLDSAQAALRQAWENVKAQQGSYWPQVSAGVSGSRNLTAISAVSPASATGNPYYSLLTGQLNVSFVPDVFGANARQVESLQAQAENQRYQLEATYLTLTSNVVTAAVQEASLRGQIAATEETVRLETDLLGILNRQLALGQVAGTDVAAQEAALAQAQQALPPLQKQLAQQRNALANLLGRPPSAEPAERFDLDSLSLPRDVPVSVPAKLVAQRPDVQAAEQSLHSASALVGVAVAARLPQITLTAQLGNEASTVSNMFTPGTNFWTIAAGLTQPIFQGGTLLHKQRAAEAGFEQAKAQYRSTVLTAMQNVADALRALQADATALRAAVAFERAAFHSLEIVRRQLALGQVAYLALLNAQQTYQQARLARVQAEANRLADTAALFQALGGGWWNRNDVRADAADGR